MEHANGANFIKNERETLRRLGHKVACNKLLSLVVFLLNFAKPTVKLTFEQTLKFVMACIIRWIMSDKIVRVANGSQTTLVFWSEEDIDIIDYGNEFDEPILPVGSKLSDVVDDNNGSLKNEFQNVVKDVNPWDFVTFGPVECQIKSTQQKKRKNSKTACSVEFRRIFLTGVLIRGTLLDSQQAGKENSSGDRACKRVLQPSNNDNSIYTKRFRAGSLQWVDIETKPRSYIAWLSLIDGSFTRFCENFTTITGIPVDEAVRRSPIEFLHAEDKCWSKIALTLCKMGLWNEPCPYRLKAKNSLGCEEYIYIQCKAQSSNTPEMEIISTVVTEVEGIILIERTRKRLTKVLLGLLNQVPRYQWRSDDQQLVINQVHCHSYSTEADVHTGNITTLPDLNTCDDKAFHMQSSEVGLISSPTQQHSFDMSNVLQIYSSGIYSPNNSQEIWFDSANQPILSPVQQQQQYPDAGDAFSQNSNNPATTNFLYLLPGQSQSFLMSNF